MLSFDVFVMLLLWIATLKVRHGITTKKINNEHPQIHQPSISWKIISQKANTIAAIAKKLSGVVYLEMLFIYLSSLGVKYFKAAPKGANLNLWLQQN